jgi:glycosyltransferase involved in cell wall biosynthesis
LSDEATPDVSVLTAVYKPRYLAETWESVRSQEGVSWEWVVQVDGDPADIETWVPADMRADARVHVEAAGHFGIAATRNLGLIRTRAPFVQTLDHDDLLLPGALATLAEALRADPELAFAFGDHMHLLPDGTLDPRPDLRRLAAGRIEPGVVVERWRDSLPHGLVPNATIWRKEYLYAYGGWSALPVGDDYGVLFAVADRHPTAYIDRVVMHWRKHPEQSSSDPDRRALTDVQRPFVFKRVDAMRRLGGD